MNDQIIFTESVQHTMFDGQILIQHAVIYPRNSDHEKELRKQAKEIAYKSRRTWEGKREFTISVAEKSY